MKTKTPGSRPVKCSPALPSRSSPLSCCQCPLPRTDLASFTNLCLDLHASQAPGLHFGRAQPPEAASAPLSGRWPRRWPGCTSASSELISVSGTTGAAMGCRSHTRQGRAEEDKGNTHTRTRTYAHGMKAVSAVRPRKPLRERSESSVLSRLRGVGGRPHRKQGRHSLCCKRRPPLG